MSFLVYGNNGFEGCGDFYIVFFNKTKNNHISYYLNPKGSESLGGNMFGFDIENKGDFSQYESLGYNLSISGDWEDSEVVNIFGFGEKSKNVITDTDILNMWYKKSPEGVPNELVIDRKTIDFIAIELSNRKWIYICSGGIGDYSVHFNKIQKPDEFIKGMLYEENESNIKLLEVIE